MYRVHYYTYTPILVGAEQRYRLELPTDASPIVYKTLTNGMRCWYGQLTKSCYGQAGAFIREGGTIIEIEGKLIHNVANGGPCAVMEHLTIDGEMKLMIGPRNILNGDQNFINFGIPSGKHIRIDIYTGESKVIE